MRMSPVNVPAERRKILKSTLHWRHFAMICSIWLPLAEGIAIKTHRCAIGEIPTCSHLIPVPQAVNAYTVLAGIVVDESNRFQVELRVMLQFAAILLPARPPHNQSVELCRSPWRTLGIRANRKTRASDPRAL